MNKEEVIKEIGVFLEGSSNDIMYLVNVETNRDNNIAYCTIHEPNKEPRVDKVEYEPFLYMKDLSLLNLKLYPNSTQEEIDSAKTRFGITITKLNTGNQDRLKNGYVYRISSTISYNSIISFLRNGSINPFEKVYDEDGNILKDDRGWDIHPNRDLFYTVTPNEQFFISKRTRLYKGFEDYDEVHRVTFDIETTGLRYEITRIFAIGVRDNRGFQTILEVDRENDDESEIRLIKEFFKTYVSLKPGIICGYNSEMFDFDYILGRAGQLGLDIKNVQTTLSQYSNIYRRPNASFKYGGKTEKYTATNIYGMAVIDTMHGVKRVAELKKDILETNLEYIAQYSEISKEDRTYVDGEDGNISKFYFNNRVFLKNEKNKYIEIPEKYQKIAWVVYDNIKDENKENVKSTYKANPEFTSWVRDNGVEKGYNIFTSSRELTIQYLLDDLWETEQVDYLYSQSSFLLTKLIPTTYQRISTMGTAAIWNLLLTAWSYDNDLAIPIPDESEKFSGGLARTFKVGYIEGLKKIDFGSLYPMIQLTYGVFPMFDITGVMEKILVYLTSTRNVYKNLARGVTLKPDELGLLSVLDHENHEKYLKDVLDDRDKYFFNIKQEPIKTLNNSLFGALGSHISFNWSDNVSAGRITGIGRIELRHAITWFGTYGCTPLYAVTDGINFHIPEKTNIRVIDDVVYVEENSDSINEMWKYGSKVGIDALMEKFNEEELDGYMVVDDDGTFDSCLNIKRINYATLSYNRDRKTGEKTGGVDIKMTGNSLKSKTKPTFIQEFIEKGLDLVLSGDGVGFVEYYYEYVDQLKNMEIPLIKIATKRRYLNSIKDYNNRGTDINGRLKSKQAHMELVIQERRKIARELYLEHIGENENSEYISDDDKMKMVEVHMPPEPEIDSMLYYYNIGTKKSHGDSKLIINDDGEEVLLSKLINKRDIIENPNMKGEYNYQRYIAALNNAIKPLFVGFSKEVQDKIEVKINRKGELIKHDFNKEELKLMSFDYDSLEDTMYLEDLEVDYWNKTGYDPKLIWSGIKMRDDSRVVSGVYESALNYLNNIQKEKNNPLIKSVNDKLNVGDYVLLKKYYQYDIGKYDGISTNIVRKDIKIPKSEYDVEYEEMMYRRYNKLTIPELKSSVKKFNTHHPQMVLDKKIFNEFAILHGIDTTKVDLEMVLSVEESKNAFEKFSEKHLKSIK